jgi:ribosomal protein S18 acetylase RimI-like enzyme
MECSDMHHRPPPLRAVEQGLKDIGCPKPNLQVRASNIGVLRFYKANGYDVEDRASLGKRLGKHE